jgi:hypothetical protein
MVFRIERANRADSVGHVTKTVYRRPYSRMAVCSAAHPFLQLAAAG